MQVEVEKVLQERGAQNSRASTLLQAVMAAVWQDRLLEQQGAGTKQFASARPTNLTGSSSTAASSRDTGLIQPAGVECRSFEIMAVSTKRREEMDRLHLMINFLREVRRTAVTFKPTHDQRQHREVCHAARFRARCAVVRSQLERKAARMFQSIRAQEELAKANGVPYDGISRGTLRRHVKMWWRGTHHALTKHERTRAEGVARSRQSDLGDTAADDMKKRWHYFARNQSVPLNSKDTWTRRKHRSGNDEIRLAAAKRNRKNRRDNRQKREAETPAEAATSQEEDKRPRCEKCDEPTVNAACRDCGIALCDDCSRGGTRCECHVLSDDADAAPTVRTKKQKPSKKKRQASQRAAAAAPTQSAAPVEVPASAAPPWRANRQEAVRAKASGRDGTGPEGGGFAPQEPCPSGPGAPAPKRRTQVCLGRSSEGIGSEFGPSKGLDELSDHSEVDWGKPADEVSSCSEEDSNPFIATIGSDESDPEAPPGY
jgi:hypothetical protein